MWPVTKVAAGAMDEVIWYIEVGEGQPQFLEAAI